MTTKFSKPVIMVMVLLFFGSMSRWGDKNPLTRLVALFS